MRKIVPDYFCICETCKHSFRGYRNDDECNECRRKRQLREEAESLKAFFRGVHDGQE